MVFAIEVSQTTPGSIALASVTRYTPSGTYYTHSYNDYDLDGHLEREILSRILGEIIHSTDQQGRKIGVEEPFLSQRCAYDAREQLTESVLNQESCHYGYDDLSQIS